MKMLLLLATVGLAAPAVARADQCAINAANVNQAALRLVRPGATVREMCEPCGDVAPGAPYEVTSSRIVGGEVQLNGREVDLAYVFVQTATERFENVGLLAGCGAHDVSPVISHGQPSLARAPRRPVPPPPPPPASPDELAGLWEVTLTPRADTCAGHPTAPTRERWTITSQRGRATVRGPRLALAGSVTGTRVFRATLRPNQRPSGAVLDLSLVTGRSLLGTLIRAEPTGDRRDPVCVVRVDLSARRVR